MDGPAREVGSRAVNELKNGENKMNKKKTKKNLLNATNKMYIFIILMTGIKSGYHHKSMSFVVLLFFKK